MLAILKIENLINNIKKICDRFPISFVLILISFALFFTLINFDLEKSIENYTIRGVFSIIITFFFSLWVYITSEKYELLKPKKTLFQLIPIWFWIVFFTFFNNDLDSFENAVFFMLSLVWIISYIFFAPYLKKCFLLKNKNKDYYAYFYKISLVFFMSFIVWGLLFLLWAIGIWATFTLFDLNWTYNDDLYGNWAIISLALITPIFALTKIPEKTEIEENTFKENLFFNFILKYIAIPFILVYFVILYAYTIKVLFNFSDWPKGEVSWLVIGFSTFWYLIYIFSYIFQEKNIIIKKFRTLFPFVVIPQIFMLFYAIYLRIAQYDLTTNRYFVVVFWLWLLVISLFLIFSKKKFIGSIPFLLTIFTIIISVWPWSVYSLPETRQMDRLEKNLTTAWILKEWTIIALEKYEDIDKNLSKEIYNWISYLCHNSDCEWIKELFLKQFENKEDISKWEIVEKITSNIKVRSYYENDKYETNHVYLYIDEAWIFPIELESYTNMIKVMNYTVENNNFYAKIDTSKNTLEIIKDNVVIDTINIEEISKTLYENYKETYLNNLSKEKMSFKLKSNKYEMNLILESINIRNLEYTWTQDYDSNYVNWYLLIKEAK